jgi:PhnB protein
MQPQKTMISAMLAVSDTPVAVEWYQRALGATVLWSLGAVAGLEIAGAPFFLGQPENNGWESPSKLGITSTQVEVFCDDPDTMIARALEAGAISHNDLRNHQAPWGTIGRVALQIRSGTFGSLAIDRLETDTQASICPFNASPQCIGLGSPCAAQHSVLRTGSRSSLKHDAPVMQRCT